MISLENVRGWTRLGGLAVLWNLCVVSTWSRQLGRENW